MRYRGIPNSEIGVTLLDKCYHYDIINSLKNKVLPYVRGATHRGNFPPQKGGFFVLFRFRIGYNDFPLFL